MRPSTKFIRDNILGDGLVGVELGVFQGVNSLSILSSIPTIQKLYLVDPWIAYPEYPEGYEGNFCKDGKSILDESLIKKTKENVYPYLDKVEIIKMKSDAAAGLIPNNLDFVYIDANHATEYVKRDIELYWPKIKKGGILAGHDYDFRTPNTTWGVTRAVNDWMIRQEHNGNPVVIHIGASEYLYSFDWWVVKT